MRYVYQIRFHGCHGGTLYGYARLYADKKEAEEARRKADGCGLRYGAFLRRVAITQAEFDAVS